MTRIVSFSDGFSSASAPVISPSADEVFSILNNQSVATNVTGLLFSSSDYTSALVEFELFRAETGSTFRQNGSFVCVYNGSSWSLTLGSFSGDSLIQDTLVNDEHITLTITSGGQVQYTSGNMSAVYSGELKCNITRFLA